MKNNEQLMYDNISINVDFGNLSQKDIRYQLCNLRQLTFEITDACNLQCIYCGYGDFYDDHDKRENKMFSVTKAIRLLDYLTKFWNSDENVSANRNIYISFYGGEPSLNMPFIEIIVDYVKNKINCHNRNFIFSITTNAILLNKYMDFFVKNHFNILISLDGNATNNSYRVDHNGNSVFERIISNVNLLIEKYPEYFKQHVNFNAVLHNRNSVEEIYNFFKNGYDKIPAISELNSTGINSKMRETFMQTYRNAYQSLYQSEHYDEIERDMFIRFGSYQTVSTFLFQYSDFVFKDYNELLFGKKRKIKIPTGTCIPFSKKMFVTVNGKILPCERIGHQYALGEITDIDIRLDFEEIAEKYNQYYSKIKKQCLHCFNKKSCIQCIFNLDDLETTCICHGFMNEQDFKNYVNSQIYFLSRHPEDYYRIMEEVIVE
jgi:uncharacterized protein